MNTEANIAPIARRNPRMWRLVPFAAFFLALFFLGPRPTAYVDPALLGSGSDSLSVIVAANNLETAATAVDAADGNITSELWLIDAVGAVIPRTQVDTLSRFPGVRAIVSNHHVEMAADPGDGYVSNRHRIKESYRLSDAQLVPAAPLPDGGAVSIAENGSLLILDADGSVRATVDLPGGKYKRKVAVSAAGTIYITKEEKGLYAISPAGTVLWRFEEATEKFKAAPVAGDGVVYAVDEKRTLYALDESSGQELWRQRVGGDSGDNVEIDLLLAEDGTLYVVTKKGYLFAISPAGEELWRFVAPVDKAFYTPLVGTNGVLYVANDEHQLFGLNAADGALLFTFEINDHLKAAPVLGPDNSLYIVGENLLLTALNPDGTVRFTYTADAGGKFKSSPVVSADGSLVVVAAEDKWLFALDTSSGDEKWRYEMRGKIKDSPLFNDEGQLVAGSEGKDLVFLTAEGDLVHEMILDGKLVQTPGASGAGDLLVRVDDRRVVSVGRLPDSWDGTPDVLPTDDPAVWEFYSPVSIDVGADVLHDGSLGRTITGRGVTVAVLDSGVYFDRHVKELLGADLHRLFVGQADFVGDGTCMPAYDHQAQEIGYCWSDGEISADPFGHGSHVAGIIWNNYKDYDTGVNIGIAPNAHILSVRVLDDRGIGTYEDVIEGIQYVVANKELVGIDVLNMSLSAHATTPYFVDPLNRAVEAAWEQGIVVVVAAGNEGAQAETITVPGNDPYVITVGAVDSQRTAGYWADDTIPSWSATGPTKDGFVKPDVLAPGANVVSFIYNDPDDPANASYLARVHPDYSQTASLFRMNGTSMSAAVTSGVVALMLEAEPTLTPAQVKFRLMYSARAAVTPAGESLFSPLQQGAGRIWAPAAVLDDIVLQSANAGMDIAADLAHPWRYGDSLDPEENSSLDFHYLGPVQRLISDDGLFYLYFVADPNAGESDALGIATTDDLRWMDSVTLNDQQPTFGEGSFVWNQDYLWSGARYSWSGGRYSWSGARYSWSGARYSWSGARYSWSGARYSWSGARYSWSGARYSWSGARYSWSGTRPEEMMMLSTVWVDDN